MLGLIILFILLSPGFLLTIPAISGRYFRTNKTSPTAVIVHGIIFGLIVYLVRKYYSANFFEGFKTPLPIENEVNNAIKNVEPYLKKLKADINNKKGNVKERKEMETIYSPVKQLLNSIKILANNELQSKKNILSKHEAELSKLKPSSKEYATVQKKIKDSKTSLNQTISKISNNINTIKGIITAPNYTTALNIVNMHVLNKPGSSSSSMPRPSVPKPNGSSSSYMTASGLPLPPMTGSLPNLINLSSSGRPFSPMTDSLPNLTNLSGPRIGSSSSYKMPNPLQLPSKFNNESVKYTQIARSINAPKIM